MSVYQLLKRVNLCCVVYGLLLYFKRRRSHQERAFKTFRSFGYKLLLINFFFDHFFNILSEFSCIHRETAKSRLMHLNSLTPSTENWAEVKIFVPWAESGKTPRLSLRAPESLSVVLQATNVLTCKSSFPWVALCLCLCFVFSSSCSDLWNVTFWNLTTMAT